jgi:SAM-dependent methyltransferase
MRSVRITIAIAALALAGACKGDPAQARVEDKPPTGPAKPDPTRVSASDEQARFDRERHPDQIVRALDLKPGAVVADVGAGTGLLTIHLARAVAPGGKVVATDVDGAVLDMLESRLADAGLVDVVERRVVSADLPGLEPGRYDAILLAQVDHYFSDPAAWLRAAAPALKPNGKLVIENRTYHREPALTAAAAAGLHLVAESTEIPGEFIATFQVNAPAAAPVKGTP